MEGVVRAGRVQLALVLIRGRCLLSTHQLLTLSPGALPRLSFLSLTPLPYSLTPSLFPRCPPVSSFFFSLSHTVPSSPSTLSRYFLLRQFHFPFTLYSHRFTVTSFSVFYPPPSHSYAIRILYQFTSSFSQLSSPSST